MNPERDSTFFYTEDDEYLIDAEDFSGFGMGYMEDDIGYRIQEDATIASSYNFLEGDPVNSVLTKEYSVSEYLTEIKRDGLITDRDIPELLKDIYYHPRITWSTPIMSTSFSDTLISIKDSESTVDKVKLPSKPPKRARKGTTLKTVWVTVDKYDVPKYPRCIHVAKSLSNINFHRQSDKKINLEQTYSNINTEFRKVKCPKELYKTNKIRKHKSSADVIHQTPEVFTLPKQPIEEQQPCNILVEQQMQHTTKCDQFIDDIEIEEQHHNIMVEQQMQYTTKCGQFIDGIENTEPEEQPCNIQVEQQMQYTTKCGQFIDDIEEIEIEEQHRNIMVEQQMQYTTKCGQFIDDIEKTELEEQPCNIQVEQQMQDTTKCGQFIDGIEETELKPKETGFRVKSFVELSESDSLESILVDPKDIFSCCRKYQRRQMREKLKYNTAEEIAKQEKEQRQEINDLLKALNFNFTMSESGRIERSSFDDANSDFKNLDSKSNSSLTSWYSARSNLDVLDNSNNKQVKYNLPNAYKEDSESTTSISNKTVCSSTAPRDSPSSSSLASYTSLFSRNNFWNTAYKENQVYVNKPQYVRGLQRLLSDTSLASQSSSLDCSCIAEDASDNSTKESQDVDPCGYLFKFISEEFSSNK